MEKMYYYRNGDQQYGPVSIDQMRGVVTPDTYVWAEGMANWQQISQLPDLQTQLGLAVAYQQPTMQEPQPSYQTSYQSNDGYNGVKPPKPNNHLIISIICALICQPLGIIAIVMAVMCDSAYNRGDYQEAEKKAKTAKTLATVGLILGLVFWVFYIGISVFSVMSGAYSSY